MCVLFNSLHFPGFDSCSHSLKFYASHNLSNKKNRPHEKTRRNFHNYIFVCILTSVISPNLAQRGRRQKAHAAPPAEGAAAVTTTATPLPEGSSMSLLGGPNPMGPGRPFVPGKVKKTK